MRRVRIFAIFHYVAITVALSSCIMMGPDYVRPPIPLPKYYPTSPPATASAPVKVGKAQHFKRCKDIPKQWWELFHSKPLNELVIASFKHNPNIGVAQATLHGALENVYAQQGAFYPSVNASFSPTKQQTAKILTSVLSSNEYNYSLYTGQIFVNYTLDVFGSTRRQLESLIAQARLQRFQLQATYLTLASNVVYAAIQEAALRAQIQATQHIIRNQKQTLSILRKRQKSGDAAVTEITLQAAALATSEAALSPLQKQLELQHDLLNALTGRFPGDNRTPEFNLSSLQLPTDLPLSLPSALLEHRPDIRAAEEQMHSANALIGVATANRLPNVTLGVTNAGAASESISSLFQPDTQFWGLAGIITQPIFDAGTLMHKQRFTEAMYEQAKAQYQATIINAFQNVADTLKSIRIDAMTLRSVYQATTAAEASFNIARRQLAYGDTSTLAMLVNEQLYLQAKLNLIQAQADRLSDTVALFQALGGGWWSSISKDKIRS
jgi:NodT family efflux transporter outer membrane factor (OMF) lipoprotein